MPGDWALLLHSSTHSATIAVPSQRPFAIFCPLAHRDIRFSILNSSTSGRKLRGIDLRGERLQQRRMRWRCTRRLDL